MFMKTSDPVNDNPSLSMNDLPDQYSHRSYDLPSPYANPSSNYLFIQGPGNEFRSPPLPHL